MTMNTVPARSERLTLAGQKVWDLVVIGGGITGASIALEAARAGLAVLLLEQNDFAWGTSSRSSKMVHGGLRYLASGHLKLTMQSVREREQLLAEMPGLVELMIYVWPHYKGCFPGRWLFGLLLRLYDLFAGKSFRKFIPASQIRTQLPSLRQQGLEGATQYADAITDDARLVLRVLLEAQRYGALVLNYVKVCQILDITPDNKVATEAFTSKVALSVVDQYGNQAHEFYARSVVNATGAWAERLKPGAQPSTLIRPCRGSHLAFVRERLPLDVALTLSHPDDARVLFIYPWETVTVVGTTDLDERNLNDHEMGITLKEVQYLLAAVNYYFPKTHLKQENILSTWAGVRPIISAGSKLKPSQEKRDHSIWTDGPVITVSGGKLTTFRLIAFDVLHELSQLNPILCPSLTARKPLFCDHHDLLVAKMLSNSDIPPWMAKILCGRYGEQVVQLVEASQKEELLVIPGTKTLWAELRWALVHEHVLHLDDLLLRRTRVGLLLPQSENHLRSYLQQCTLQLSAWSAEYFEHEWHRYLALKVGFYSVPLQD